MDKNLVESFCQSCAMPMEKSDDFGDNTKAMKKQLLHGRVRLGFCSLAHRLSSWYDSFLRRAAGYDRMGHLADRNHNHALGTFQKDKRGFIQLLSVHGDCMDTDRNCV